MAGEAHTHGACVTSVLCTRVLVCKVQSSDSERGRASGEARPSATCLFPLSLFFCSAEQKREACIHRTPLRLSAWDEHVCA